MDKKEELVENDKNTEYIKSSYNGSKSNKIYDHPSIITLRQMVNNRSDSENSEDHIIRPLKSWENNNSNNSFWGYIWRRTCPKNISRIQLASKS